MDSSKEIRVAIIGATGYTGMELVRLISGHAAARLVLLTSESSAGQRYDELYPQFNGSTELELVSQSRYKPGIADVVFLALPHKVSMGFVKQHGLEAAQIIDLSADFRLRAVKEYEAWYGVEHCCPQYIQQAVYGMPELNRDAIRQARLVANPGCYPTASILPLAPLLKAGAILPERIIIDAKSGITGAGIKPRPNTHYPAANENFAAYGLKRHRHTPEIEEQLSTSGGHDVVLQFTPHLLPVNRGILATSYARADTGVTTEELVGILQDAYRDEPFIRVKSSLPALAEVRGSNYCDIHVTVDDRTGNALIVSAIDNLVKGAAGQAIHNFNIMFGLPETTGLAALPLAP